MVIFVDIDGTICHSPENLDYSMAVPDKDIIRKINDHYDRGDRIVYWTARGTLTGKSWQEITKNQLNDWGVKYHQIIFGKPFYDKFIDDKAINIKDFKSMTLNNIPELKNLPKIDSFQDAVKLSEFVYSTVSHCPKIKDLDITNVMRNYPLFKSKELCGWCYANALFLHMLLREYGRDSTVYNYGFPEFRLTHVVTLVMIKDKRYLLDPYFCRYYTDLNGTELTFESLTKLIANKSYKIKSVYGNKTKSVFNNGKFEEWKPEEFEKHVLEGWVNSLDYEKNMKDKFNGNNPLFLINKKIDETRIIRKSNGEYYFEFF